MDIERLYTPHSRTLLPMADDEGRHHFLVVAYGVQSHVNPGRALARRLARLDGVDGSITATLSVPVVTYRRMFPSSLLDSAAAATAEETTDGVISYVPYSDGLDDGSLSWPTGAEDRARMRRTSADSLSAIVARLAGRGQPVTCIACTMVLLPVLDVAQEHGIPLAVYWLQPATVLAVSYHYFHGLDTLVAAHATDPVHEVRVPGLSRPLRIGSLPSFLTDTSGSDRARAFIDVFRELFEFMDRWQPKVLVNTFDELEPSALAEMKRHLDVVAVGPMVGSATDARIHLFEHDKKRYMEWLQAHPDNSVVYVSFGSVTKLAKRQMEEIAAGLRQCGRPYLLAVRRDGVDGGDGEGDGSHGQLLENDTQSEGMVVNWCNQLEVLSHPAVGCFVSHCGWNSATEAMASGVPIVGVPNMFDQPTNMYLIEEELGVGVRGERNGDGVLTGTELARCIELVMGDGARAVAIRERAKALKERAQAAALAGGSAERNLCDLVKTMSRSV
ncbi:cyanidin 3-O-rutinoside 5-O-glucosyltransferase-like [Miscanthus floridulus]|uniref:cyanidin 3-O-rutinoside 5-O-glucosyltransferase-like n=1 Tax=Miscanthus floridulus TaxID=154761 RepID=UPI0034573F46